jgi:hypothetical protein
MLHKDRRYDAMEYGRVQAELTSCITHRTTIATFGGAAIAGVIAAAFAVRPEALTADQEEKRLLMMRIWIYGFSVVLPLISATVLYLWYGEFERMVRAGHFLVALAERINKEVGATALTWDVWCRANHLVVLPNFALMGILSLVAIGSPLVPSYVLGVPAGAYPTIRAVAVTGAVLVCAHVWGLVIWTGVRERMEARSVEAKHRADSATAGKPGFDEMGRESAGEREGTSISKAPPDPSEP